MQKAFWLPALLLAIVVLSPACKQESGTADVVPTSAEPAPEGSSGPLAEPALPALKAPALLSELKVETGGTEPVTLVYQPVEKANYAVTLKQVSTQHPAGKTITMGMEQSFILERTLVEGGDRTGWAVQLRMKNLEIKASGKSKDKEMDAAMSSLRDAIEKARFRLHTTPSGKVEQFVLEGEGAERWAGMKDVLEQLVRDAVIELPDHPVKPGDTWQANRETKVDRRKTVNRLRFTIQSRLVGMTKLEGHCTRCAVVQTDSSFVIDGDVTAPGMTGRTVGKGLGSGVAVIDVDRGVIVMSAMASSSGQAFVIQSKGRSQKFDEVMESSYSQELVEPGLAESSKPTAEKGEK
jgi:hypothetical protein